MIKNLIQNDTIKERGSTITLFSDSPLMFRAGANY